LIAVPIVNFDFIGNPIKITRLHVKLHELVHNWICPDPPIYEWTGALYKYKLVTVRNESEMFIAQLLHTGPDNFVDWLTKEEAHSLGALPWGYKIKNYQLINNVKEPIILTDEHEFFDAIGYEFIDLDDRNDGNPSFWRDFKK
jgi:hypothetical protein